LAAKPVLDGQVDCGLPLRELAPQGWTGAGGVPGGRSARWVAAWRPDGLYLFVEVTVPSRAPSGDPASPYCGDAVEFYVDSDGAYGNAPAYDAPGTIQVVVPAPRDAASSVASTWRGGAALGPAKSDYRSVPLPNGYAVEAFVRAAELGLPSWSPAAGGRVGLNLSIDLGGGGDPACRRLGQFSLRTAPSQLAGKDGCVHPWCNVSAFCRPSLL
jgi:hypothetical protein